MKRLCILGLLLCAALLPRLALAEAFTSFWINTQDQAAIQSKEEYIACTVTTEGLQRVAAQIKGHGNSTWLNGKKKAYRVKFAQKRNPLGIGDVQERDWILLANYFDKSLLRNYTAFALASRLDGLDASVPFGNVNLYLNGEYHGVYLLCQRIEPNSCGLDIDESQGFLLELDTYSTGEGCITVGDKTYAIKSDYAGQERFDEIYYYIDDLDTAIMQGDEDALREGLDLDSWVDSYLVNEFLMNTDVGFSSFYMYRPDGQSKLYAGPLWDFDLSAGNNADTHEGLYTGLYASEINGTMYDNQWFAWLMETEWFSQAVRTRWHAISDVIDGVIRDVEEMALAYAEDFSRNFERWPVFHTKLWMEPNELMILHTHQEHAAYLIRWLRGRKAWLNQEWS